MTEDSDQHRDKRQKLDSSGQDSTKMMEAEYSTQPTNHDRNEEVKKEEGTTPHVTVEDFTNSSDDVTLDQLQKDMGEAFLLGRSSKTLCLPIIISVY